MARPQAHDHRVGGVDRIADPPETGYQITRPIKVSTCQRAIC